MSAFEQFLAHTHRRWIIWRVVERAGLCILISSILAAVLSIILIARGESSMALVLVCLSIGLIAGALLGWITRPSLFDSATEADRQLGLADLLGTALSIRRLQTVVADDFDQQWSSTILAHAEARCATLANESLILRKFGAGAWGGIGLSAAIVLTLGALSTNPLVTQARDATPQTRDSESSSQSLSQQLSNAMRANQNDAEFPNEPDSAQHTRMDSTKPNDRATKSINTANNNQASASVTNRGASGSGKTDSTQTSPTSFDGVSRSDTPSNGENATGGNDSANTSERGNDRSSSTVTSKQKPTAPPWDNNDWSDAQNRATDQIRAGHIPDTYRDLVRDYFAR
jgi:hypothetical protein